MFIAEVVEVSFGQWLLLMRRKLDLTQSDVAKALQISAQTVRNWEAERSVATFTVSQMRAFCNLLGCKFEDIPGDRTSDGG